MGVVIPADFPSDHSGAEFDLFRRLRDETPSDWTTLHSVGLSSHEKKVWGEIDFVVITDRIVVCLEVKGGQIDVVRGRWTTNGQPLRESPFEQAGGNAGALKRYLRASLDRAQPLVGWAVAFPRTRYHGTAPWSDPELVYDDQDLGTPIHVFLDRVADHWLKRSGDADRMDLRQAEARGRLLSLLAPTFGLGVKLYDRAVGLRQEFIRLTREQAEILEGFVDEPRLVMRGGAGTGKTVLALTEAERLAAAGKRVLLLCVGAALANDLQEAVAGRPGIEAHSALLFGLGIVTQTQTLDSLPEVSSGDFLARALPEAAARGASHLPAGYDAVVVDEAQDLLTSPWLDLLDRIIVGGLRRGTWRIFFDPNQQIVLGADGSAEDLLDDLATSRYRLTRNCRNTRQIATSTALYTGLERLETLQVDGPDVEEVWYGTASQARSRGAATVRSWLAGDLQPEDILVLSCRPLAETSFAGIAEDELGVPLTDCSTGSQARAGTIRFGLIEDFKGLEADAVLVLDVDDLSGQDRRLELYVGLSRAKVALAVLLDDRVADAYRELVEAFGDRVATGLIRPR